jgi:hypothetical protein
MFMRLIRALGLTKPALLIGLALGITGGAGGMLVAFPYVFPPEPVDEAAPLVAGDQPADTRLVFSFRFDERAEARDFLHWANGGGMIIRTAEGFALHLDARFASAAGPDFRLYLNTRAIATKADFEGDAGKVEIRKLKAFKGSQTYALPREVAGKPLDPSAFHSVTIWCKFFNAYVGTAPIEK